MKCPALRKTGSGPRNSSASMPHSAREKRWLAGFERGEARVFPGRDYRFDMRVLPLLPLWLRSRRPPRPPGCERRVTDDAAAFTNPS
jgi:hypothetical protein